MVSKTDEETTPFDYEAFLASIKHLPDENQDKTFLELKDDPKINEALKKHKENLALLAQKTLAKERAKRNKQYLETLEKEKNKKLAFLVAKRKELAEKRKKMSKKIANHPALLDKKMNNLDRKLRNIHQKETRENVLKYIGLMKSDSANLAKVKQIRKQRLENRAKRFKNVPKLPNLHIFKGEKTCKVSFRKQAVLNRFKADIQKIKTWNIKMAPFSSF